MILEPADHLLLMAGGRGREQRSLEVRWSAVDARVLNRSGLANRVLAACCGYLERQAGSGPDELGQLGGGAQRFELRGAGALGAVALVLDQAEEAERLVGRRAQPRPGGGFDGSPGIGRENPS